MILSCLNIEIKVIFLTIYLNRRNRCLFFFFFSFSLLTLVHFSLCRRKIYDRTGSLEDTEQFSGEQFDNLYNFYRSMYTTVTEQDINDFAATYKEGADERADILRYYEKFEGNMTKVFDWVMLSDPELDSHRYMDLVNAAIESGQVQKYKKYTTWATAVAKKKRPAPVVPGAATTKGGKGKKKAGNSSKGQDSEQALVAMMQQRQRRQGAFEGMLSSLASKYGVDDKEIPEEPTEEEFEAARKRVEANKASGSKSKKRQSSGDGEKKQPKKKI